jgi:hypothetical protein
MILFMWFFQRKMATQAVIGSAGKFDPYPAWNRTEVVNICGVEPLNFICKLPAEVFESLTCVTVDTTE